jgi:hypothetical protein
MHLSRLAFKTVVLMATLSLSSILIGGPAVPSKIENPWKRVQTGTILEFKIVTDEGTSLGGGTKHAESTETWTLVGNDGRTAVIEIAAGGTVKRIERDLAPVDPFPEPPAESADRAGASVSDFGAPDGRDRIRTARDRIETPLGVFDALRIDHRMVMLESESRGSEWRAAGFPEPLKATTVHSGGAGVVRTINETRTMIRFETPASTTAGAPGFARGATSAAKARPVTWRDFAVGTNFDVQVEKEHTILYPPGRTPTTEKTIEHWTLLKKDENNAAFEVTIDGVKSEKSLPLALEPPPADGTEKRGPEEHRTASVDRERISTPLGNLDCLRIRRAISMNEAGGQEIEWRAPGFPLPVRTRSEWSHKQQKDVETGTIIRFERLK